MSQRLLDTTKWLWCLLVLQTSSLWTPAGSVTIKTPPSNPSTIEAQAKFFQDFFSVQLSPYKIEFGHVCEDPNTWEQRYEKKDFKNHRDMGKVRWGDKKGGYGEHYWDLNHAGNSGNHGNEGHDGDDGSYHEPSHDSHYEEPHNNSPNYDNDEYDSEKSSYGENERAKRAHPKIKIDRRPYKTNERREVNEEQPTKNKNRKQKEQLQAEATHQIEEYADEEEDDEQEEYEKPKPKRHQYRKQEDVPKQKERNQVVLVVSEKDDSEKQQGQYVSKKQSELPQYVAKKQPDLQQYVPYEEGAGIRQHRQPEVSQTTKVPRLFLEPSTGHVVDRATGQAYVLQPIAVTNSYN